MEGILFTIPIVGLIAYVIHLYLTTRHEERMALIESGQDASLLKGKREPQYMGALKWGLFLMSLGCGITLGIYYDLRGGYRGPIFTICNGIIGGGIGLILYYFIARKHQEEEEY